MEQEKIKLPYIQYYDLDIKDFAEFIHRELLKSTISKYGWIYDIGDNLYYYLDKYFQSKHITYNIEDLNPELEDTLCNSIYEQLSLC